MKALQTIKSCLLNSSQVREKEGEVVGGGGGEMEERNRENRRRKKDGNEGVANCRRPRGSTGERPGVGVGGGECTQMGGSCRGFPHVPPSLCWQLPLFFVTGSVSQVLSWVFLLLSKSRDKET